jgi:hypothetical protein
LLAFTDRVTVPVVATPEQGPGRENDPALQDGSIDILMVTHDRPAYTRLSLERLLSTCDGTMRVWLWHNGEHEETLEVVGSFLKHPQVQGFHHSPENTGRKGLWRPTNWLLSQASGGLVSKVDDDCLVSEDWADVLRRAHEDVPELGVVGCWRFRPEDFRPTLARAKITEYAGDHRILRNCWVEGSGFLMKRACVASVGLIPPRMGFPTYCVQLAAAGWIHGWYYPFLYQEHMGDPRSPYWSLERHAETAHSARRTGPPPDDHVKRIRARALYVQRASLDPRRYAGWRAVLRRARSAALSLVASGPASGAAGW